MTAAQKLQEMNNIYRKYVAELEKKYDAISMSKMQDVIANAKKDFPYVRYINEVIEIEAKKAMIAELGL